MAPATPPSAPVTTASTTPKTPATRAGDDGEVDIEADAAGAIVASRDTVIPAEPVAGREMTTRLHTTAGRPASAERAVALLAAVAGIVGA